MAPRLKQDYPALIAEYERRIAAGESLQEVKSDFTARGINFGTFDNQRRAFKKKTPTPQEPPMIEEPVDVLPGQVRIEDTDTAPAEVHYGAVHEFDTLPDGYAKVIQPMRPYSDAEEWALNESMRLYGFIGAIVCDQFGRVLDGNQRQRIARLRGLSVPHTITHVRDDAHAIEIATAANAVRRHYTQEQRQELAPRLRDQGFSYRAIADALGVGRSTVYRDVLGELRIRPESVIESEIVPNGTLSVVTTEPSTQDLDSPPTDHAEIVPNGTMPDIGHAEQDVEAPPAEPPQRVKRKGGGTYPAKRPNGTKPTTSPADRQLAQVINLLMSHAQQWNDQHWQAFLEVVQNLRGSRAVPAAE